MNTPRYPKQRDDAAATPLPQKCPQNGKEANSHRAPAALGSTKQGDDPWHHIPLRHWKPASNLGNMECPEVGLLEMFWK